MVPTKLRAILTLLAAVALLAAACSSTTVVARDERGTSSTSDAAADAGQSDDDASDPAQDDGDRDDDDQADGSQDDDAGDPAQDDADAGAEDAVDDDDSAPELEAAPGFGLGGTEQLESLLIDCDGGSDLACDVLFQLSEFDSVEENAALTCGGRSETTVTFCTPGIETDGGTFAFDITSEGLDVVVEACVDDADMTACDFLYYRSPLESELEALGATCGDRVPVAVPDCRTFLTEAE